MHDDIIESNIRTDPYVSGREGPETQILKLDEDVKIPWHGEVLLYDEKTDPNGPWIGLNAEDLAEALLEGNYITPEQAETIINKEDSNESGDYNVWVSKKFARYVIADDNSNMDSISYLNGN